MPTPRPQMPYILLDDHIQKKTRFYQRPRALITAYKASQILPALKQIDDALAAGHHIAGYASYELGFYLNSKLTQLAPPPSDMPLLCFGIFDGFTDMAGAPDFKKITRPETSQTLPKLTPNWSQEAYLSRFERIKTYIQNGDIYQANLTFPYTGKSRAAPDLPFLYKTLRGRQPVRYGAIISLGEGPDILSLSPELFFKIEDGIISARPMKGTAARSQNKAEDSRIAKAMQLDEKSRAENLMIVDLLRNDLSRLSKSGSVKVTDLFTLESYPTLHQLTSGIEARLKDGLTIEDIFTALFPCGSVTGAPKLRAMEIIHELEAGPRGPYCGAIGYFDPNGNASFNVAIRTLTSQKQDDHYALGYHVGSGIVADSRGEEEYAECLLKANIVTQTTAISGLRETLKWSVKDGYSFYEAHMLRLMTSANKAGLALDPIEAMHALDDVIADKAANKASEPQRISLTLHTNGKISTAARPLTSLPDPVLLSLSKTPLSSQNPSLRLKSLDMRQFYDQELSRIRAISGAHEALFFNELGQLCEGSYSSVFLSLGETLYTPPLSCGLLPGLLRDELLHTGRAFEKELTLRDLKQAEAVYIGNSVRGLCRAMLINTDKV